MRRNWLLIAIGLLTAALAIGAVACGDDDEDGDGATVVNVRLFEYSVLPDPSSVPAGSVTFSAENEGPAENHELVIISTDLEAGALPTLDDGSVDETQVEVIGKIEEFAPEGSESITLDLEAGSYVLICNIVEEDGDILVHYDLGMRRDFDVTE